jgi:hypothetical protein
VGRGGGRGSGRSCGLDKREGRRKERRHWRRHARAAALDKERASAPAAGDGRERRPRLICMRT